MRILQNRFKYWKIIFYFAFLGQIQPLYAQIELNTSTERPADPISFTVPPLELQNGGEEIFSSVVAASELVRNGNRNVFISDNSKFDLSLLGPGTNVIFVTDPTGKYRGFAFSNGRFERINNVGSVENNSYPNQVPKDEGKYPWPRDHRGHYLPGSRLTQSNGPHGTTVNALKLIMQRDGVPIPDKFIAGHVGRNTAEQVFIGYVSASTNTVSSNNGRSQIQRVDGRALAAENRQILHSAIEQSFKGLNLNSVLAAAPVEESEVLAQNAVQHFPNHSLIPRLSSIEHSNPLGLLITLMSPQQLIEYIQSADPKAVISIAVHLETLLNVIPRIISNELKEKIKSKLSEVLLANRGELDLFLLTDFYSRIKDSKPYQTLLGEIFNRLTLADVRTINSVFSNLNNNSKLIEPALNFLKQTIRNLDGYYKTSLLRNIIELDQKEYFLTDGPMSLAKPVVKEIVSSGTKSEKISLIIGLGTSFIGYKDAFKMLIEGADYEILKEIESRIYKYPYAQKSDPQLYELFKSALEPDKSGCPIIF